MTSSSLQGLNNSNISAHGSTFNVVGRDQITINHIYPPASETQPSVYLPRPFNDAPVGSLSLHFSGRTKELDLMEEILDGTQNGRPSCCIIHGMPGVGKSQLSLRYAEKSFEDGRYPYIFWTSATSVDKSTQGFSRVLDLVGHPYRHLEDQSVKLTAARLWLEEYHVNWLLIIDNVDRSTLDFLRLHCPREGNILFTTRTVDVALALVNMTRTPHCMLKLQTLNQDDTTNLLFKDAGIGLEFVTPSRLNNAKLLVEAVGRLPLAVVQAASFMRETHTTLDEMLELYNSEEKIEVIRWESDLTLHEERSVAATFSRQLEQLNGDISNLLKVLSFLDPENIPVCMIVDGAKEWLHSQDTLENTVSTLDTVSPLVYSAFRSLATLITSPIKFQKALQTLQGLSLIERRSDNGLWMHDLIEFMVQDAAMKEETYREWLQSSVSLVCSAFRLIEDVHLPDSWEKCERFISHLRSLGQMWGDAHGINLELSRADVSIAKYLYYRARYQEAEALNLRVLAVYEKHFGTDHLETLASVDCLGDIYWRKGQYDDAETFHERALVGREEKLEPDHLDTLVSMNRLALVYWTKGRYNEAEVLHKRALEGRVKKLGVDHRDTLRSVDNCALVYRSQSRYNEAEVFHKRALVGRVKNLGLDHWDTMASMSNLAVVYIEQERYDEAGALLLRTLTLKEKKLGADHPSTLISMNHFAHVYSSRGWYGVAEKLHLRVLAGRLKHLGADHPHTLVTVNDLAHVYSSQKRYDEAEKFFLHALAGREKHLGADHPDTIASMTHLVGLYESRGRCDKAQALQKRALAGNGSDQVPIAHHSSSTALSLREQDSPAIPSHYWIHGCSCKL